MSFSQNSFKNVAGIDFILLLILFFNYKAHILQFELDMLAQRGELIRAEGLPDFRSAFRASNLQGALELLEELRQTPINYQLQHHLPDARGYSKYPAVRDQRG